MWIVQDGEELELIGICLRAKAAQRSSGDLFG